MQYQQPSLAEEKVSRKKKQKPKNGKGTFSNEVAQTNDSNRPPHEERACPFPIHYNFLPTLISFLRGISPLIGRQQHQKVKHCFSSQVINKEQPH